MEEERKRGRGGGGRSGGGGGRGGEERGGGVSWIAWFAALLAGIGVCETLGFHTTTTTTSEKYICHIF